MWKAIGDFFKDLPAKLWALTQKVGKAVDRLIPPVVTDFMTKYPGLSVVAAAAVAIFWGKIRALIALHLGV